MKRPHLSALACVLASIGTSAAADSITYDPGTGNYLLAYECDDENVVTSTIEPHNKIAPSIESGFSVKSGAVVYNYQIELGAVSRQPLRMVAFDPIQPVWGIVEPPAQAVLRGASPEQIEEFRKATLAGSPAGWRAINFSNLSGTARVGWARQELPPSRFVAGSTQSGFSFSSRHLAGVIPAIFRGDAPAWVLPCEGPGPGPVADALEMLIDNDHVPRFAVAPVIRVPEPFDVVVVLTNLHDHTTQLETWQLMEPAFATQVRGFLNDAIARFAAKDMVGGSQALARLRIALREKYPSLDSETVMHATPPKAISTKPVDDLRRSISDYDRLLAARALDFDVHFIQTREDLTSGVSAPCAGGETCSPTVDVDGNFDVTWKSTEYPCTPVKGNRCVSEVTRYVLEMATKSDFSDPKTLYSGLDRAFYVAGLVPGSYLFRVVAHMSYCDKPINWGSYCVDNPDVRSTTKTTYASSQTIVGKP